jgi:hypothetical protein
MTLAEPVAPEFLALVLRWSKLTVKIFAEISFVQNSAFPGRCTSRAARATAPVEMPKLTLTRGLQVREQISQLLWC